MAYSQWTIGSTTVRNPDRLRDGLIILKNNFEGRNWDLQQQEKFFDLIVNENIYEMNKDDYKEMSSDRKQEHARKWISVMNQLGFSYAYQSSNKPVVITKAGKCLMEKPELEEEVFLRQLLKYQKPCILPKQYGEEFKEVNILPFIASLEIIYKIESISKEEISIFLNTTIRMEDIPNTIKQIRDYRIGRAKIEGMVKLKEYYYGIQHARLLKIFKDEINERLGLIKQLIIINKKTNNYYDTTECDELLSLIVKAGKGSKTKKAIIAKKEIIRILKNGNVNSINDVFLNYFIPIKMATLSDYSDLTARYLAKTGLFSIKRNKLAINSEKENYIKTLIKKEWKLVKKSDYLDYLWDDESPSLPSDKVDYLEKNIIDKSKKEEELFHQIGDDKRFKLVGKSKITSKKLSDLKQLNKQVEDNLVCLKEVQFYHEQSEDHNLDDILNYYDLIINRGLLGGEAYYPAYLEWNTWRVFLAINTLFNQPYEARNFKIDEDLQPINQATGNQADMVFEYEDFILVTEVTLNTGSNQYSAESEPVPRHVAKVQYENDDKKVFGIFIAREIDMNTVLTFFNSREHIINGKKLNLTIIPMTIEQIKFLLAKFKKSKFSVDDMKSLFIKIEEDMNSKTDAIDWYKEIPALIKGWQ